MEIALSVVERIARRLEHDFEFPSELQKIYRILIQWIHGDPEFEKLHGYLSKGILIMGPTGTGKTLAMKVMSVYREIDNVRFRLDGRTCDLCYDVVDVNRIILNFIKMGYEGLGSSISKNVFCMDDLGSEVGNVHRYKNEIDIVSYIIEERYSQRLLTLATTNCTLKILKETYSDRIISRMFGMFNFITLDGPDYRKKNKKITRL